MSGGIFVSYRRDDSRHAAGRLVDRLGRVYGRDGLFMDIDGIEPGGDFLKVINDRLSECAIVLAVIGPDWIDARDRRGRRRLENPGDFVRMELETALRRGVKVIPVLVDGASMPRDDELPEPLKALAFRNAVRLHHESFAADSDKLAATLGVKKSPSVMVGAEVQRTSMLTPVDGQFDRERLRSRAMVIRVILLGIQISAALLLVPMLKTALPNWRTYDIFQYALLHAVIVGLIGMLATVSSRWAPVAASGAMIVTIFFALGFAAITMVPQAMQMFEGALPALRGNRWLYPLFGALIGHLLMTSSRSTQ